MSAKNNNLVNKDFLSVGTWLVMKWMMAIQFCTIISSNLITRYKLTTNPSSRKMVKLMVEPYCGTHIPPLLTPLNATCLLAQHHQDWIGLTLGLKINWKSLSSLQSWWQQSCFWGILIHILSWFSLMKSPHGLHFSNIRQVNFHAEEH